MMIFMMYRCLMINYIILITKNIHTIKCLGVDINHVESLCISDL
jgi:hypothetical protein